MMPVQKDVFRFDNILADPNLLQVRKDGAIIDLEPKAQRVLFYLIRNRRRVVTKEELITGIWGGASVTDNALTRVIAQIRKQLGDSARSPRYIETSSTTGYRFIAVVTEGEAGEAEIAAIPDSPGIRRAGMPRWWWAAGSGVVALCCLAWWLYPTRGTGVRIAGTRQITSSAAADLWPSFSPDGSQLAFSSNRSGSFEVYVRSLAPGGAERQVTSDKQDSVQPAWSPDGQYLAFVPRRRGGIAMVPVSGGATRYLTGAGDSPSWSPDGRALVYRQSSLNLNPAIETTGAGETTIWMLQLDGSPPRAVTRQSTPPGGHNSPRWSPDGKRVIFSSGVGTPGNPGAVLVKAWAVDPRNGRLEKIEIAAGSVRSPVLSPDQSYLYYLGAGPRDPGLWRARIGGNWRTNPPELLMPASASTPRDLAISPDGKHVVFSQQVGESAIWSVPLNEAGRAAGEPMPLIPDRSFRNSEPVFSADGSKLAYSSVRQGGEYSVFVANADGSAATPITVPDWNAGRPSWFGSDLTIGYRALFKNEWSYWVQPLQGTPRRLDLKLDLQRADRMRVSRDGARVVAHFYDPARSYLVMEDLATHAIRRLTPEGRNIGFPCWSPDGRWIAAESRESGNSSMVYLSSEGGEIKALHTGTVQAFAYDWSPDSDKIGFAGLHDGVWDIWGIYLTQVGPTDCGFASPPSAKPFTISL